MFNTARSWLRSPCLSPARRTGLLAFSSTSHHFTLLATGHSWCVVLSLTRSFRLLSADDDSMSVLLTHSLTHRLCKTLNASTPQPVVSPWQPGETRIRPSSQEESQNLWGSSRFMLPCQVVLHPVIPKAPSPAKFTVCLMCHRLRWLK